MDEIMKRFFLQHRVQNDPLVWNRVKHEQYLTVSLCHYRGFATPAFTVEDERIS